MNPISNSVSNSTKYLMALAAIAVLAVGAVGVSAMFAKASAGPTVNTTTTNSANTVVTSAGIGTNVFEGASVASSTASTTVPTGTVTFSSFANQSCTGTATVQSGVALVNGMASSSAQTVGNAGLSYIVNYNGDASNTPSVSSCAVVTPTTASVSIVNGLSATTVNTGSTVTNHAVLTGATANATGTVAYNVYTNNTCTVATTSPASVTVTNGIVPTSASVVFNQSGNYFWQAVYSGDNANTGATSACTLLTVVNQGTTTPPVVTGAGTISGTVFSDTNNNGTLDSGETGIAGVTIKLSILQNNWWLNLMHITKYSDLATTVSDANGNYSFSNLAAGVYKVEEIKLKGVNQTSRDFQPVPLLTNAGVAGLNFANRINGSTATSTNPGKGHDKNDGDNDNDDNNGIASSTVKIHLTNLNVNLRATLRGDNGKHNGQGNDN